MSNQEDENINVGGCLVMAAIIVLAFILILELSRRGI